MSACTCNPDHCYEWDGDGMKMRCRCLCHAKMQGKLVYRPENVATVEVSWGRGKGKKTLALKMLPSAVIHEIVEATIAGDMDCVLAIRKAAAHKWGEDVSMVMVFRAMQTLHHTNPSRASKAARDSYYEHLRQKGISV